MAEILGLDRLAANLQRIARQPQDAQAALAEGAELIKQDAQARCPVQTGELRDSAEVRLAPGEATIAFTAPHAVDVHERLDVARSNGQPKFLEHAATERATEAVEAVARGLAEAIRRAVQ